MSDRLTRLRAILAERNLPALLIGATSNRQYISGFSGSAGSILVTQEAALVFTDFRYRIQVAREAPDFILRETSASAPLHTLVAEAAAELELACIGFEANHTNVTAYNRLVKALADRFQGSTAPELQAADGIVEQLREIKDAAEMEILRRAIAITDAAIEAVIPQLRPDHTERQVAWMLEIAMRELGADGVSFPIIVAAGPNSALPHARPGDEPLGSGRPVVIDMGALLNGYHADLTRTIVLGEADEQFWRVYNAVLEAQRQAIAGLRAGISGHQGDALARDYLEEMGFGAQFGHSLGHGVGMDIHEGPSLRRNVEQSLPANSIVSVEPGVYIDGWGGVRIEDLVLLDDQGCEVLSKARKISR